jgi:hypothetical protein
MTIPLTPTQIKQARRAAKEADLAAKQLALPDKRYGVILNTKFGFKSMNISHGIG